MGVPPQTQSLTLEEFERLPDAEGIEELLGGVLVQLPPPKRRHSQICKKISEMLRRFTTPGRIWLETGFAIRDSCPQPDIAVTFPNQGMDLGWFAGAPSMAIKIASRGNTAEQLEWKKELYLSHGAHEVWIVYDKTKTVIVHTFNGQAATYKTEFASSALQALITVSDLFAD